MIKDPAAPARSPIRRLAAAAALVVAAALGCAAASAQDSASTITRRLPADPHPSFANRYAVVLAPSARGRSETAASADALASRLLDYGFEVFALGSVIRADLEGGVRDIARQLQQRRNAEIALIVYGTLIRGDDDLYVAPSDLAAGASAAALDTVAVRLSVVLRRLEDAQPRRLVVIADGCVAPQAGGSCLAGLEAQLGGRAIILTQRRADAPPSQRSWVHGPLTSLTTIPGLSFSALAERLRSSPGAAVVEILSTPGLPSDFAFLPERYLETLPHPCNRAEEALARPDGPEAAIWPHIEACERAVAIWGYAPHFRANVVRLRELLAYRRAVASCDAAEAGAAYARVHPNGVYLQRIRAHQERCKPPITAAQLGQQFDDLVRRRARAEDFVNLGRQALEAGHAQAAFRAFEEADPRMSEEAAWHLARFYDPAETAPSYRAAAASPGNAIFYYALWSARSERHRAALRRICASPEVQAQADMAVRRQCQ